MSRAAKPATKASAVLAVSGGMAASFALPASAATMAPEVKTKAPATNLALLTPVAAPVPVVAHTFGKIAFTGVVKPHAAPASVVRQRTGDRVSRSAARAAVASVVRQRTGDRVSRSAARAAVAPVATKTVSASLVAPASSSSGVLAIAASLAGISYVYGGSTRAGFDCSGYTQYVFARRGIQLPRVAEAQRQATTRVSRTNAKPGDLVFFGAPAYHVGIYAGNGMMWDSPHSGTSVMKRNIWSTSATFGRV